MSQTPFQGCFRFFPSRVTNVIQRVMNEKLTDRDYDEQDAKLWTLELCNEIKAAVKGTSWVCGFLDEG